MAEIELERRPVALLKYQMPPQAQSELLQIIENMKSEIVEVPS